MLDFTSALYLGLRHPSRSLRAWSGLTTGKPIVLETPAGAIGLARQLAALQGCERATLLPSTLHLFWDLFGLLAGEQVRIYMDEGTYRIARWGVERAAAQGVAVRTFPHHDAAAARALIEPRRTGQEPSRHSHRWFLPPLRRTRADRVIAADRRAPWRPAGSR